MSKIISAKGGNRVWSNCYIPKNTFLGPYRGNIGALIKRVEILASPPRKLEESDRVNGTEHPILYGDYSWLCHVSPALDEEEQNMEAARAPNNEQIYFRTRRNITPGEELRVWLSSSLEEENGIHRISEEEMKDEENSCPKCEKTFQFSRALSVHKAIGCREITSHRSQAPLIKKPHLNLESNEHLTAEIAKYSRKKRPLEQPKVTRKENENNKIEFGESIPKRRSLEEFKDGRRRCDIQQASEKALQSLGGLATGSILSNPKLAHLISSFAWPRLRRIKESQSLAEYHKQEFRKKFQGNEHYLRRHLYRENDERNNPGRKCHLGVSLRQDNVSHVESGHDRYSVSREENKFLHCVDNDCRLENEGNFKLLAPNENHGSNRKEKDTWELDHQIGESELRSFSKSYRPARLQPSFITSSMQGAAQIPRGITDEYITERDTTEHCTCQQVERDFQQLPSSVISERNLYEDLSSEDNGQNVLKTSFSKGFGNLHTREVSTLDSRLVYQKVHQVDAASLPQQQPCCCCPPYDLTESISRYHEPALGMDLFYRACVYPRMLPFLAHPTSNPPQITPRNQGFTCEFCGKVYCRKYVLKIHMRTHTGFKPLRCKVCDKSFSDPSNMKKHVKLHETEDTVHKCRQCGRNFVRYRGLLNHIKSKHVKSGSILTRSQSPSS